MADEYVRSVWKRPSFYVALIGVGLMGLSGFNLCDKVWPYEKASREHHQVRRERLELRTKAFKDSQYRFSAADSSRLEELEVRKENLERVLFPSDYDPIDVEFETFFLFIGGVLMTLGGVSFLRDGDGDGVKEV